MAIRTRTVSKAQVEGGDPKIEEFLDSKGIKWTFRPNVSTDEFDIDRSLHNQARFEAIDEQRVDTYTEAMRHGSKFPPVIAHGTKLLIIADGNHRLMAASRARKPLAVYDITGADATLITQVGYEANTRHGWPTSEAERIHQALWLMDQGATVLAASSALAVPQNALKRAAVKRSADERFRHAGISPLVIEKLPEATKYRLAQVSTDEGFVALVGLAVQASLSTDVILALATEMNEMKSSTKQVAFIEAQREIYADQIAATGGGVRTRRAQGPKARIAIALGGIMNLPDNTDLILSAYHGPEREEAAKKMRTAARRLNEIAKQLINS